ncbi:MAG: lyase family protein, partial [Deltaproteobacteria bacterium]
INRWLAALEDIGTRLAALRPGLEVLQYGGAVGLTLHDAVASAVAAELGLTAALHWHTTRTRLADYAGWLSLATGALGKIGLDVALMAQMGEVALEGGTSSAMPHKNNPVLAEVLQALARKNATDLAAAHLALLAEQERSGASMTLEWLVLPEMVVTTGTALNHALALVRSIKSLGG